MFGLDFLIAAVPSLVLALAAVGKVARRDDFTTSLGELGVHGRRVTVIGAATPVAELSVAALLIPPPTRWLGALLCVALLVAFTTVLTINDRLGREVSCRCFGAIGGSSGGNHWMLRNVLLLGAAAYTAYASPLSPQMGPDRLEAIPLVTVLLAAAGALGVVAALVSTRTVFGLRPRERLGDAVEDRPATRPDEQGHHGGHHVERWTRANRKAVLDWPFESAGRPVSVVDLLEGRPGLLLLVQRGCPACEVLLREYLPWWKEELEPHLALLVTTVGRGAGPQDALLRLDATATELGVQATPAAVPLDDRGLISGPIVHGPDPIAGHLAWYRAGLESRRLDVVDTDEM